MHENISFNPVDLNQLTEKIIGCVFNVSNGLGSGFLEKVYENALAYDLQRIHLKVQQQHPIPVHYDGQIVGDYFADILVNELVILELKCVRKLDDIHMAQCLNYLHATSLPVCLLLNFYYPKVQIKRILSKQFRTTNA